MSIKYRVGKKDVAALLNCLWKTGQ